MEYNNAEVRRKDRLLDETEAIELLLNGEYGFLSMTAFGGGGYGIPLSYVFENNCIYFHCAPEGEKIEALQKDNRVSFCVVGKTKVIPDKFTTAYESVLVKGKVTLTLTDEEKIKALNLIVDKYSFDYKERGEKYAVNSLHSTCVIKLNIESISGKCKKV